MQTSIPPQTVGDALDLCVAQLMSSDASYGHGTDNAWDEAVQLVLYASQLPIDAPESALQSPMSATAWSRLQALLQKRIEDFIPVPYLTGRAWFAGLEFLCDPRALVPRSPIAELILNAFEPWYTGPGPNRVLDLCCGGGSIGLATAHYFPQAHVELLDIDTDALALAQENISHLGLDERVCLRQSDLFEMLDESGTGANFDIILSNPPYVDARDLSSMPREYHHEPAIGLGSGADGLDLTRHILARALNYLSPDGILVVEVGNSWEALEAAYPSVPFTWLEFERGGHGVFILSARELQDYSAYFGR